jgi:hypothetical protein
MQVVIKERIILFISRRINKVKGYLKYLIVLKKFIKRIKLKAYL